MVISDVVLGGLTKSMEGLTSQIKAAMDFADKAQKASLALGTTFEDTRESLGGTMEGLRGDINQRFAAGIAGMEAGLQGNTAGVARLVNQQMLTGTAYQQTAKAFASLEVGMNLSRDETNVLASNLVETGNKYEISTDKLVGAIEALKSTFPAQQLAGMGKEVMGAVTMLQAELGPQMSGSLNKIMTMIFDTTDEGYNRMAKLGIVDIRERLSAGKTAEANLSILKEGIIKANASFKAVAGDASKGFFKIGVATKTFGAAALETTVVAAQLGKRVAKEGEQAVDFGKTLANLKREILVPFQEGLATAYPFLLEAMDVISGITNTVGKRFKKFAESLGGKEGAAETMKNFKLAILDFAVVALGKLEGAFSFMKIVITEAVPAAMDMLSNSIFHLVKSGGVLDKLKVGLLMVIEGLAAAGDIMGISGSAAVESKAESDRAILSGRIHLMETTLANNMAEQRRMDAFFRSGQSADEFNKSYKASDKGAMGQILEQASERSFGENAKKSPMYKQLFDMRESIKNNENLARESNTSLQNAEKNLEDINAKTPEIATTPEFLDETANMLGRSIEGILGVGRDTTAEEMLEELREANVQRAKAAAEAAILAGGGNPNAPPG
jgi:hypothetical protein